MPVYEYVCTNPACAGPKKEEYLTPEETPTNLPQEQIVPTTSQEDRPCKFCGAPATWQMYHGKAYVRFHFDYMCDSD